MSCHNCAHEAADICDQRGEHLPGGKKPCETCLRNPVRIVRPPMPRLAPLPAYAFEGSDNYVAAGEIAVEIAEYRIFKKQVRLGPRTIGWIFRIGGKLALRTLRNRKKHYMRVYEGWGLATTVLEFLKEGHFEMIQIQIGKTEFLNSDLELWFKHGIPKKFPGFEAQTFLPEKYMTKRTSVHNAILRQKQ